VQEAQAPICFSASEAATEPWRGLHGSTRGPNGILLSTRCLQLGCIVACASVCDGLVLAAVSHKPHVIAAVNSQCLSRLAAALRRLCESVDAVAPKATAPQNQERHGFMA
jgi:hypothetical protein